MRPSGHWTASSLAALIAMGLLACSDPEKRPFGASCGEDAECASGLCVAGECVDPAGDLDGDGVNNGLERTLGSDPMAADTDLDQIGDRAELGANFEAIDTDGDGKPDILESALADLDGDCITDQYDADDQIMSDDPSPMIPVVCRQAGVCASGALAVDCSSGAAVCDYSGIAGFADPEQACDGRDEDCDGQVDEGFSTADCNPTPWVAPGNGTYETGSARYRASIGFGPVPANTATSTRYKAEIGFSPSLLSTEVRR